MEVIVDIVDRNEDGRGRGSVGGRTVLVSQAEPGERVRVRSDKHSKTTLQGRVVEVLRSAERRPHRCEHEFSCTGCALLATPEPAEAEFKTQLLASILKEAAPDRLDAMRPLRRIGPLFAYRHYAKQRFFRRGAQVHLGAYVAATHDVTSTAGCPVLAGPLNAALDSLRDAARGARVDDGKSTGLAHALVRLSRARATRLWVVVTTGDIDAASALVASVCEEGDSGWVVRGTGGNVLLDGELHHVAGERAIVESIAGIDHFVGPQSFFQINPFTAEAMVEQVNDWVGENRRVVEGYAGVGLFALPLAQRSRRVWATDRSEEAVVAMLDTARREDVDSTLSGDYGEADPVLVAGLSSERPEVVVVDPPRRGLGASVCEAIVASTASRVISLACEPKSLLRDLPVLLAGGFELREVVPVDQFSRTGHVEAMLLLER